MLMGGMGRSIKETGYICALSESKYPYQSCLSFTESANVVHCCE